MPGDVGHMCSCRGLDKIPWCFGMEAFRERAGYSGKTTSVGLVSQIYVLRIQDVFCWIE